MTYGPQPPKGPAAPTLEQVQASLKIARDAERRKLLDDFAKAALTGMLSAPHKYNAESAQEFAQSAYDYAEAMLEVRNAIR